MFNAPRPHPGQRYTGASTSTIINSSTNVSSTTTDPLAASAYDGLDPWSSAPSPVPDLGASVHANVNGSSYTAEGGSMGGVIGEATTVPVTYNRAFSLALGDDTVNVHGLQGETSLNALSRVLATSGLGAGVIDRIVNLVTVSTRPRVSRQEFFVALALVSLAQSGKDLSIEQVASLASRNALPEPNLDLDSLPPVSSSSTITNPGVSGAAPAYRYRRDSSGPTGSSARQNMSTHNNMYSPDDPWSMQPRYSGSNPTHTPGGAGSMNGVFSGGGSNSLSFSGTGLPREWWKRQERVNVTASGLQGFVLNRYMVYEVVSERGAPVSRRYSEFSFLWDCLVRRYPFRIIPQLPPKRVGPDDHFIEMRRRGLSRFLNFIVNHPVIKEDGILAAFLSEPSLEEWRKHASITLEEESASKRVERVEEMSIPSDLEEKLGVVRRKIGQLIEQWQKICMLTERLVKRREAAAVRDPNALFKRSFMSAHLFTAPVLRSSASSNSSASTLSSSTTLNASVNVFPSIPSPSMSTSILGTFGSTPLFGSARPDGAADGGFYTSHWADEQADLSRLNITLNALNEVNAECWRGEHCDLCSGVRGGLEHVSAHAQQRSDEFEERTRSMSLSTLEAAKAQRDLYIAVRDLFIRHDRLSVDQVERLKKRIDANQARLEGVRGTRKEGWELESEKLTALIERDRASIASQLNRRVFIRFCMWHELRVVLHNRENTLLTLAIRELVREEVAFAETSASQWTTLSEQIENMPYE